MNRHHEPSRTPHRDVPKPSLGLDLRFEQTYLKSIAPHVRLTTPDSDENEKRGDLMRPQGQRLDIKWGQVIWITTRDQVLTPMFQGVIWGSLSPWVQYFRGGSAPSSENGRPSRTGAGIAKLKSWLSSIIPPTTSFRTK
ncbi:hypothetical protein BDM02DRAFT_3182521 [Thelephora ganbajun]|uniref:Uncharacterized protein n=1 Tax=Thelephora ganbajun TaxID=370292 RepID=A0ACB6ZVI9_THEGA|nr:hypothetical protein BDM02DRAFT_3182521 [Thelephora ganbajun]